MPPMKHILNDSITLTNNNTIQSLDIAVGTLNPDPYTTNNVVKAGSVVGDIHLLLDIVQEAASPTNNPQVDMYVWFNVAGAQTKPVPGNEGSSDLKNQIFWQEQAQLDHYVGTSPWINKWRAVIKVPKWARQLNKDDKIQFVWQWTGMQASVAVDHKWKFIYKEYYP